MTTQREAFEAWAIEEGHFVGKDGAGDYKRLPAYWMWTAWQAAQAAMPVAPVKSEVVPSTCAEAYSIYIPDQQSGYVVEDLDDAIDDLTNEECEVTPLYPAYSGAFAVQAAIEADAARYRWLREGTSGESRSRGRAEFDMPCPSPIGNIMQGSVAQHLDKAIDAEITRTGSAA